MTPGRIGFLALAALVLLGIGWRVLSLGMARFESRESPAAALEWRHDFAEAILNGAEEGFRGRSTPAGQDAAVRAAIHQRPLEGRGFRLLAREAELRGEGARATELYGLAASRGPRDLAALAWLAQREIANAQFAAALSRFDQMQRVEPELSYRLTPAMVAVAQHGPAQPEFARLLLRSPPWRTEFLQRLIFQAADSGTIFPFIEQLRSAPGGLNDAEMRAWLDRLARDRQWGTAYLTWVRSLSPEASRRIGNIYNGSFELEPSQHGFDWRFEAVPGARVSRTQVTGAKESLALRVEFEGRRVQFQHVRQLLALAPGDYVFRGRMRLDDLRTDRGLVWTLTCAEDGRVIGETEPLSGRREWRSFEIPATVPAENCGGQWLTLRLPARIPAEQRIGGVAWFDDLQMKSN